MIEDLTYAISTALAVSVVSATVIAVVRRRGWIGPLLDAEARRPIWLRTPALVVWIFGMTWGRIALIPALAASMDWVGTTLGWIAWVAFTALGVGVALL